MARNSKIGKQYGHNRQNRPSNIILPRSRSLSVQSIKTWKDAVELASLAENPNRAPLMDVYRSITRDLHLKADMQTRILKIMGAKFKITDVNGKENTDLHKLFESQWFNRFLFHAMKAKFWGSSVIELWDLDPDTLELKSTNYIPSENVLFTEGIITKEVGDETGYSYKEGVYQPFYIQAGTNNDLGILENIAPDTLAKKFAKSAWLEFCEKYGIAPRWVTTDSYNTERHKELAEMMASMVNNHWAVLQGNEKIEVMDTQGSSATDIFDKLILRMNSEMSKGVLGQDGTTNSNDKSGTYGSLKVMQDVADDRHNADKADINYLINDELLWRLEEISPVYKGLSNYRFDWDESKELTPEELIETVVKLSTAGYSVDLKYITENTGIPISEFKAGPLTPEGGTKPTPGPGVKKKAQSVAGLNAVIFREIQAFYPEIEWGTVEATDISSYSKLIEKIAKDLHSGKIKATDFNEGLVRQIYSDLNQGTAKGYGKSYGNYTRDPGRKMELEKNIFKFSAAKSYQEQARLNFLLKDEKGNRRTYAQLKVEAAKMDVEFNQNHLKTEVGTFQRAGAQVEKWGKYEQQKHLYPNLEYKTAGDGRVRDEHDAVANTIKPIDDKFWDKWYPPNGWNCRCYVVQTSKGPSNINPEANPTMGFHNNVGKTLKPMDDQHPYFIFPEKEASKIRQAFENLKLKMPEYRELHKKGKAKLECSIFKDDVDFERNLEVGKIIVDETKISVKIRPHVKLTNYKNPEYSILGERADLKWDFKKNNYKGIKNGFKKSKIQGARIVVFDFTTAFKKLDINKVYRRLNGTMIHGNNDFDSVILRYHEKSVYITRKEFLEGKAAEKVEKLKTD